MSVPKTANDLLLLADRIGIVEALHTVSKKGMSVSLPMSAEVAETDIYILDLTIRAHNSLIRADISTVGRVAEAIKNGELGNVRNLGHKGKREVMAKTLTFVYGSLSGVEKLRFLDKVLNS